MENITTSQHKELDLKSKRCCETMNKSFHLIANEPSLGLYRLQQHVHKLVPKLDNCEAVIDIESERMKGLSYDISLANDSLKNIASSANVFENIETLLRRATVTAACISMKESNPSLSKKR